MASRKTQKVKEPVIDQVNHPPHYKSNPSGIEAIEITRHFDFSTGNALKYLLRHEHKGDPSQDLQKARWYVLDRVDQLRSGANVNHENDDVISKVDQVVRHMNFNIGNAILRIANHSNEWELLASAVEWIEDEINRLREMKS